MNVLRCEVINLPAFQTLQTLPAASRERPPWLCPQSRHTPGTRLSQNSGLTIGSVMQGALAEPRSNHVLNASDVGSNSIFVILITSLQDAEGLLDVFDAHSPLPGGHPRCVPRQLHELYRVSTGEYCTLG